MEESQFKTSLGKKLETPISTNHLVCGGHSCNPSYLGDNRKENCGLRLGSEQKCETLSENN
jgi:hypothetical protein